MSTNPWNWHELSVDRASNGSNAIGYDSAVGAEPSIPQRVIDALIDIIAPCAFYDAASVNTVPRSGAAASHRPLYSPQERQRRDATVWTKVQGVLAPIQFAIFLASLCLVVNYLLSGNGYAIATASVIVKTFVLYTIMITGSIWEKKVFGKYLFAAAFFWEDAVSMLVIALHTSYLAAVLLDQGTPTERMVLALAAYAAYAVNAAQFILKLRAARLESSSAFAKGAAG